MIDIKSGNSQNRSAKTAIWDGVRGRCPNCHEGALFAKYLKVADNCDKCGEEYHHHRADDAPAYFVIFIVGHILVPLVLFIEVNYGWPLWVHATLWLPVALGLSLTFLPITKGALVAIQWANFMHGFDKAQGITSGDNSGPDLDHDLDRQLLEIHEAHETARTPS